MSLLKISGGRLILREQDLGEVVVRVAESGIGGGEGVTGEGEDGECGFVAHVSTSRGVSTGASPRSMLAGTANR